VAAADSPFSEHAYPVASSPDASSSALAHQIAWSGARRSADGRTRLARRTNGGSSRTYRRSADHAPRLAWLRPGLFGRLARRSCPGPAGAL